MLKKISYIIIFLFVVNGRFSALAMESDAKGFDAIAEENIETFPKEIIYCILKELFKTYVADFMLSDQHVNLDKIFPIKQLCLINKTFKELVKENKISLLKLAITEMCIFGDESLSKINSNILLSKILMSNDTLENEKKVILLVILVMHYLLKTQDNVNQENPIENFLMAIARNGKFKNIISLMSRFGSNINIFDDINGCPLIVATRYNQVEVVDILLKHGADTQIKHNGQIALEIARLNNNGEIIKLLDNRWFITKFFHSMMALAHEQVLQKQAFI